MAQAPAIGIDLGTTHTVAAVYVDGQPIIIPNTEGGRLTPSLVFYDPRNLRPSVGKVAENQSLKCPRNYMFDMKRIIGRNFFDVYVQNFVKMEESKNFPIQIIRSMKGDSDVPVVKLESTDDSLKTTKSAEEISSEVLKYIKKSVKEHLGVDVQDAVISVPAYFSYAQRAATKRAAEMVGFNVLKLITEPVAAAIHYTFKKSKTDENLLMFDLGGGTLDVSIISVTEENFIVKSIEGDMFLGGRDFDDILFEYLRIEVGRRFGNQYINPEIRKGQRLLHRLRSYAKRFKEMLSSVREYSMTIDIDGDNEVEITISRRAFERLSEQLLQRIIDKVIQCLESAGMSESDINKVVLVGGSSRIPKVRKMLSKMFSNIELSMDINPDEAVALGASIHAALLTNQIENRERYNITEVAPFSVGILAKYHLMVDFIAKGSKLPAIANQIMHTTENNQRSVDFEIFEGERKNCKQNNRLGGFSINNLPPGKAGDIEFDVTFDLDEDGLLTVSAKETYIGTEKQLQIEMQNLTLCGNRTFISLEEEYKLREEDILYDQFFRLRLKAETFCKAVLHDLEDANLRTGPIIERECVNFLRDIQQLDYTKVDDLKTQFEGLMRRTRSVFHENGRALDFETQ